VFTNKPYARLYVAPEAIQTPPEDYIMAAARLPEGWTSIAIDDAFEYARDTEGRPWRHPHGALPSAWFQITEDMLKRALGYK
jgi:hypothetical protein